MVSDPRVVRSRLFRLASTLLVSAALLAALTACSNPPPPTTPPPPTAAPTVAATAHSPTSAPAGNTPSGLSAEALDTVIKLSWQSASGASGYFVFRDGNAKPLNPTPITETTYEDIGLTNGRTYTYTVAAADASGQAGPMSTPIEAAPKSK